MSIKSNLIRNKLLMCHCQKIEKKVRPESCYIYKSTLARQDESTFILNLAVISVNEEQESEYLRNELSVALLWEVQLSFAHLKPTS